MANTTQQRDGCQNRTRQTLSDVAAGPAPIGFTPLITSRSAIPKRCKSIDRGREWTGP